MEVASFCVGRSMLAHKTFQLSLPSQGSRMDSEGCGFPRVEAAEYTSCDLYVRWFCQVLRVLKDLWRFTEKVWRFQRFQSGGRWHWLVPRGTLIGCGRSRKVTKSEGPCSPQQRRKKFSVLLISKSKIPGSSHVWASKGCGMSAFLGCCGHHHVEMLSGKVPEGCAQDRGVSDITSSWICIQWNFLAVGDTIWTYLLDFKVLLLASLCEWMENIHRWVWRKALPANLAEQATGVADALGEQATGVADASAHLKRPSEQTEKRTFELLQTIQTYITLTNYRCVVTLYVLLFAFFKFGF